MITANNLTKAINYIREWHKEKNTEYPLPNGITKENNNEYLVIQFGDTDGSIGGKIKMKHGQFQVTHLSSENGYTDISQSYNYASVEVHPTEYIEAFKTKDLGKRASIKKAITTLTSECCRSVLMHRVITEILINGTITLDNSTQKGLELIINKYSQVAAHNSIIIHSNNNWRPLDSADYIRWASNDTDLQNIQALRTFSKS